MSTAAPSNNKSSNHRERGPAPVEPFSSTLARHDLELRRGITDTLQVSVGLLCNQACRHCHLEAGPTRREVMSKETMDEVAGWAGRFRFSTVDITGGAPEMNPNLGQFIESIAPLTDRVMLRSNLTALGETDSDDLLELLKELNVVIVASLPATKKGQTDSQRGAGVYDRSIAMLKRLNDLGYGQEGGRLELDFVSSPPGAFLPNSQKQVEERFKRDLKRRWGIVFNNLYTFANVPLGRFLSWLKESGNIDEYVHRLASSFNPCTIDGLMCRSLVSVSWDGFLFDCDFNLARGLYLGGRKRHVSEMAGPPEEGLPIATGDHCYACTAGSGFT